MSTSFTGHLGDRDHVARALQTVFASDSNSQMRAFCYDLADAALEVLGKLRREERCAHRTVLGPEDNYFLCGRLRDDLMHTDGLHHDFVAPGLALASPGCRCVVDGREVNLKDGEIQKLTAQREAVLRLCEEADRCVKKDGYKGFLFTVDVRRIYKESP